MSAWISTSDRLPPFGQYVLGYYSGGNWSDNDDPNRVVVKRIDSRDSDPTNPNNRMAGYEWRDFGPHHYFGHDISYWTPIAVRPQKP